MLSEATDGAVGIKPGTTSRWLCAGWEGYMSLGLEKAVARAVTVLLSADFQDYQHAGSLVCGWEKLPSFSGACFQDP